MHTRAYRQDWDRASNVSVWRTGKEWVGKGGQEGKRGNGRRRNKPNNHNFPFVEIVLIDESFAKMAIRPCELEGL